MKVKVLDVDGKFRDNPDFPVAVVRDQRDESTNEFVGGLIIDPVLNYSVYNNLFGRIMTLVEATTDASKLKPVKDLFTKELASWNSDVYNSARELSNGGNSSRNLYSRHSPVVPAED